MLLPLVAGQSGNTGAQALAVTMRGLALQEIRVGHWFRVSAKEVSAGFLNGVSIALLTAVAVFFWSGSQGLALVIGISMIISMVAGGPAGARHSHAPERRGAGPGPVVVHRPDHGDRAR